MPTPNDLIGPFHFRSSDHVYTVGTVAVPAISTILRWTDTVKTGPWMLPEYRARGKAVHEATLAVDLGEEGEAVIGRLHGPWRPFLRAYLHFRASCVLKWQALEEPVVHRRLRFAGTPDRIGTLNQFPTILEIKTGHAAAFHSLQLAGQELLLGVAPGTYRRYVVYLLADGRFRLREFRDHGDHVRFLDALRRYHEEHPFR